MILSLEALQAKQGDSLILYYGQPDAPSVMLIDGGPAGVYNASLKPRLLQLKERLTGDEPLPVTLMMVSHADDDHIHGILDLTNDLIAQGGTPQGPYLKIDNFWFNSFDDIIGNKEVVAAAIEAPPLAADHHVEALIASTGQGRKIRSEAEQLGWSVNSPFTALPGSEAVLVRGDTNGSKIELDELRLTVLHPGEERLGELQKKWDEDLKKAKDAGDNSIIVAAVNVGDDDSPFNLSSIVCLLELGGKRVLLTGDGRCDDILAGLKRNGSLDANEKLHVDILKMPHHGSFHNMNDIFLQKITADHYVFSADGKYSNPDQLTLDMVFNNVKNGTVHFTNYLDIPDAPGLKKKIDQFSKRLRDAGSAIKVKYRQADKRSFVIDLLEPLTV